MKFTTEDQIETYNLELLDALGYCYTHGAKTAPDDSAIGANFRAKDTSGGTYGATDLSLEPRQSFADVLLKDRLTQAIERINPHIPPETRHQAQRELQNIVSPDLIANNETFHRYLTEGITVEYQRDGETTGKPLWLIDWDNLDNNEFLAVNQFTVIEDNRDRRPDIILFVNGLPLVVIELKNAADAKANLQAAFNQLDTYKREIPSLFTYNVLLIVSDGISARAGSLSATYERFSQWKRQLPNGEIDNAPDTNELEILTQGMLNKSALLDLIRHFTVFEKIKTEDPKTEIVTLQTIKKLAAYHQYYAVNKAVESVLRACGFPSPNPSQREGNRNSEVPIDEVNLNPEVPLPMGEGFRERANLKEKPEFKTSEASAAYRGGLPITTLLDQARELRKRQTPAETIFWETVRTKRFYGLKFRRQHQIGTFIADFYCHQHQLVIELDGNVHNQPEQQQRDRAKDEYLRSLGHTVLRFSNQEIFDNLETVLRTIVQHLGFPSPNPSLWEGNRSQSQTLEVPLPMGVFLWWIAWCFIKDTSHQLL